MLNICIRDQDLGQLATASTISNPITLQRAVRFNRFGPLNVHRDGRLFLDQPESKNSFNVCAFEAV